MKIRIVVPCPLITWKTVAWGEPGEEQYRSSQEAIRHAVQSSPRREDLRKWLESRTKLYLEVTFCLSNRRVSKSDMDSLLSDLLNPLVEGACGPRPAGKPIPQTKDSLFWQILATKVQDQDEKIVMDISEFKSVMK